MVFVEVAVHELAAGDKQLLHPSGNKGGLSTSFSDHLDKVLRLRDGGRHLLLGRNGCGKSTLLRAIQARRLPGWPQAVDTYLVDQELSMDPGLTALEFVLRADIHTHALRHEAEELEKLCTATSDQKAAEASKQLCRVYQKLDLATVETEEVRQRRAGALLKGLGFVGDLAATATIAQLSGGWRMRVALAAALFVKPCVLMLDEPTNHLDMAANQWLRRHLVEDYRGTILCVSHDRSFINQVCTEIIIMADQSLTHFSGTLDAFDAAAADRMQHLERQAAALEKKREHLAQAVKNMEQKAAKEDKHRARNKEKTKYAQYQEGFEGSQRCSAIASKQQKLERIGMEKTADGRKFKLCEHGSRAGSVAENEGGWVNGKMSAAPIVQHRNLSLRFGFPACGELGLAEGAAVLQLKAVSLTYPGSAEPVLVDVDLSLCPGRRIALVGENGTGKSTLLKLIAGELEPSSGEVWRKGNAKFAIFRQHEADALVDLSITPMEYLQECFPSLKVLEARTQLGAFGVTGDMALQPLRTLSGGERVRVLFAKLCAEKPQLLLLDEPTNHLDIYAIDAFAESLKEFRGAVVLVTHNQSLIQEAVQELYVLERWTKKLRLVGVADPDGPQLEIPSLLEEEIHDKLTYPRLLPVREPCEVRRPSKEQHRRSATAKAAEAPAESGEGAPVPRKQVALPPWLRR